MKTIDQPSSETSPLTRVSGLLALAALTSTSGMALTPGQPSATAYLAFEDDACGVTRFDRRGFPALATTARWQASVGDMSQIITATLAKHQLSPDRTSITGDGSHLLQFFRNADVEGGVDIFPNGDIVVIIRKAGISTVFEIALTDLQRVPVLLLDAGIV